MESLAEGVVKLIVHNIIDAGYHKWRAVVYFLIECGCVDHIVVIFPRLTEQYLRDLIFCCAGFQTSGRIAKMDTDHSHNLQSRNFHEPIACGSTGIVTESSAMEENATSDQMSLLDNVSSLQCNDTDRNFCAPVFENMKLDLDANVKRDESYNASDKDSLVVVESSECKVDLAVNFTEQNDTTGKKGDISSGFSNTENDDSVLVARVLRTSSSDEVLNHQNDLNSSDEETLDLFDEALVLPVVSPEKSSNSSKHAEEIRAEKGASNAKTLDCISEKSCSNDSENVDFIHIDGQEPDIFVRRGRGVKKFVLSHSFCYNDDSEVDAVAMILCEVLQCWTDLTQFAMMHVYTETDKLGK
jgi:hypothetical protein